jgi:outer membrane lipoprotein carrier protein
MKRLLLITILLLLPLSVSGEETQQETGAAENKTEVFNRIRQAASNVQTLAGEFTQEKHLKMLENPSISKGRFFYKNPDCLRWEVYEPVSMGFIVNGDKGKRWQGQSKSIQPFDLKKEPVIQIISGQVFAWARADFKRLEAGYNITVQEENPVTLDLSPLSTSEQKYIDHIRLTFSSTEDYVSMIEIHEGGGDYTRIKFIDMTVNKPIQEDIF